jgi:hypothetical protein
VGGLQDLAAAQKLADKSFLGAKNSRSGFCWDGVVFDTWGHASGIYEKGERIGKLGSF